MKELAGKRLAIIAIGEDSKGKTEAAVFTGKARWRKGHLFLDRGRGHKAFQLPDDTLGRIKAVPEDISDIVMDSQLYVTMSIGPLPDDADPGEYIQTGLKWPD